MSFYRYLLYLTLALLTDEPYGIFREQPPSGALLELEDIEHRPSPAAEWELDHMWQETLQNLPDNFQNLECSVHETKEDCQNDHSLDKVRPCHGYFSILIKFL